MRGVFDEEERLEPVHAARDTEFTLGSGTLLLIFFGLVLLCGMCFGLGYAFGHRSPSPIASVIQPEAATANSSLAKPSATPPAMATPSPTADDGSQPADVAASTPGAAPAAGIVPAVVQAAGPAAAPSAQPGQAAVHPALAVQPATSAGQSAAPTVQSALAPSPQLMVQIAAVSDVEDADVLVSALRKHGYAVVARREPADNLIHVRIGPFSTRDEALRWRQKLLNDGYNAIVQP